MTKKKGRTYSCLSTSSNEDTPKRVRHSTTMATFEMSSNEFDEKLLKFKNEIISELNTCMDKKFSALKEQIINLQEENARKNKMIQELEQKILVVKKHAINNEQYTRRENVRVFGIAEDVGENCVTKVFNLFREKVNADVKIEDVEVAHRVKGPRSGPRGIIVRFANRAAKASVIRNRRALKDSGVVIVEDLCHELNALHNHLRKNDRVGSAWAWNGKICAKLKNSDNIFTVEYGQSLDEAVEASRLRQSRKST